MLTCKLIMLDKTAIIFKLLIAWLRKKPVSMPHMKAESQKA